MDVPGPARKRVKSARQLRRKLAESLGLALAENPFTESLASLDVAARDSRMSLASNKGFKCLVAHLPRGLKRIPRPPWQRLKMPYPLTADRVAGLPPSLISNPIPKRQSVFNLGSWNARVPLACHEMSQRCIRRVPL